VQYFTSNSPYETDFGVSSAFGAGNTKIGFLKARRRRAFKKPIFIMRITGVSLANNVDEGVKRPHLHHGFSKMTLSILQQLLGDGDIYALPMH
jgi:hypothetical protein